MSPILALAVLSCFVGICNGWMPGLMSCLPLYKSCQCGEDLSSSVYFQINQCRRKILWRWLCTSCEDFSDHCARLRKCETCHQGYARECKSCPPGKFGIWCDLECKCKNGASCDRKGRCLCPEGFLGTKCEIRCGQPHSRRTPLIRNGNVTRIGQWPWQAALYSYDSTTKEWELRCGGSLLSNLWIVTAAHCVADESTHPIPVKDIRVFLGKYHRKPLFDNKHVQEAEIARFHVHEDYEPHTVDSDIALIELKRPVKFTNRVLPVCLPTMLTSEKNIVDGNKGEVTGWGLDENNVLTDTLQQAGLPVVTRKNCEQAYQEAEYNYYKVTQNMFCAAHSGAFMADSCRGDSGGPMVFRNPFSKTIRWILEGIVSWGSPVPPGCGIPKQFGGYVRVSNFLSWIKRHFETS